MNVLEKIWEEIIDDLKEEGIIADNDRGHRAVEIIRSHMDEVKNDGWIPVGERLPDAGSGKYYPLLNVATSYGAVKCGFYRVTEKQWYIYKEIYNEFVEARNKEVVAWRPLPEPYKEEKKC